MMLPRSLSTCIYLFVIAITIQLCAVAADLYYQDKGESLETAYLDVVDIETSFLKTIAIETDYYLSPDQRKTLTDAYQNIRKLVARSESDIDPGMISERLKLINRLSMVKSEQSHLHGHINGLLPSLSTSVQYIHEHHIAYLRNLTRRGKLTQDYDRTASFERSPIKAAPELDIIQAAIAIQNAMLETFEVFSRLQRGYSPNDVIKEFSDKINLFYKAINTFEDFSLDAQDGLLVEELLINGRIFEDSFKQFVDLEQKQQSISASLDINQNNFIKQTSQHKQGLQKVLIHLERRIEIIRYLSLSVSVSMMIALFIMGHRIIKSFNRTLIETKKLQDDLSYRIPIPKNEFSEFLSNYNALNLMATTISHQVNELEKYKTELEKRVASRTIDLSEANARLKAEIKDRIKSEKERRSLEEKLARAEKMEALGTLAGGVAHDLNNVLSGIVSYPEIMLWSIEEDSPLREPILTIQQAGKKASDIVEDLLTLARRGVSARAVVALNDLITDYVKSPEYLKLMSYHKNVRLVTDLDQKLMNITASPIHIRKTIMNLVSNAAEAQPDGGEIRISTYNHNFDLPQSGYEDIREGDFIALEVSDKGYGIAKEDLERIFEPFYTKKVMGRSGTGLGMAVVWGTVQDHQGYIDIKSTPGKGTSFFLYFPVTRDTYQIERETVSIQDYMGNGELVLIVDDIREQTQIAAGFLEILNYQSVAVFSGEEAVEYLKTNDADLMILDMIMSPGMDGLETYQKIMGFKSDQKAIIASGYAETDRVKQVQKLGAGQYIKKPYTLETIAVAIWNELNKEKLS